MNDYRIVYYVCAKMNHTYFIIFYRQMFYAPLNWHDNLP